jgi:hypothetical protein
VGRDVVLARIGAASGAGGACVRTVRQQQQQGGAGRVVVVCVLDLELFCSSFVAGFYCKL